MNSWIFMGKQSRGASRPGAIDQLTRDIAYGCRGLWRERTFAITTVTTLAVALALVTVMFALLPALHATRLPLTTALGGEFGHGVRGSTLRSVLVVGQVAVSLVLIGIRMALGATAGRVVRLLMTQSARLVAIGGGAGLVVSFALLAVLRTFIRLENVSVLDAGAFAASASIIGAAAFVSTYVPGRRATHIDPSETLRADG